MGARSAMKVIGFDHLVINTRNIDGAIEFYRDVLGLQILREEEYRAGKASFPSVRVTDDAIIDLRPYSSEQEFVKNVDHICLRISPTDMVRMRDELKARGLETDDDMRVRWGAQGYGESIYLQDPEGQVIELKTNFQGERLRALGWDARPRPDSV